MSKFKLQVGRGRLKHAPRMLCAAAVLFAAIAQQTLPVSALTLDEALGATYDYNPRLDAERARLRATDEDVSIAKSGYRPDIRASADLGYRYEKNDPRAFGVGDHKPRGYSIDLAQPVFTGFRVTNAVNEAEARVRAGREALRRVEQEVLAEAVQTFMEVVRDQAIVRLNENNLKVLSEELKATQDRFSVGEVTRTDVAQSEARRARALAELDLARGNYQTSRGNFERTVGQPAVGLVEPALKSSMLPKSIDEALAIADQENPRVVQALYLEQEARFRVDSIRGNLLPQVDIVAGYRNDFDTGLGEIDTEAATVRGVMTVPLYQEGGRVHAEVRQAKHEHVGRIQDIEEERVRVKAFAIEAWARFQAARAALESAKAQVEANKIALNGVREEERVGQRTLIEVLNAQQELLDSQVEEVRQRADVIIAAYALQAALGRLDAMNLGVTSLVYDPEQHYSDIRRKWWGISITHEDGRRENLDLWPGREEMK